MAGKLGEKAREIRKSLFKFFCFCSAATPTADDGEAPRQQDGRLRFVVPHAYDESIAVPHQPQMGDGEVPHQQELRLTRDVSRVLEGRVSHKQVSRVASVPRQSENGERRRAVAKTEIASILDQMTGGASSIEEVQAMYEFIERGLTFTRSDLPVFQPSQAAPAPRPVFAPRATFTPGAIFVPPAPFTAARIGPGAVFLAGRVVA